MRIEIIRHQKVNMEWASKYNASSYDLACQTYDQSPIITQDTKLQIPSNYPTKIYISELSRTYETAYQLFGERDFIKTNLLNEVPLRSFHDFHHLLPVTLWNVMGRLQWFIGSQRQSESKRQTIKRAQKLLELLESAHEDCCLVTHGFFMHTLLKVLKKQGYHIDTNHTFGFSNLERLIAYK